jgi:uncharacterized SAM-binding protein YcdF (DUF218 family)
VNCVSQARTNNAKHLVRRWLKRLVLWFPVAIIVWLVLVSAIIWRFGAIDSATHADCIIVLGAAVYGNSPSPVFEERVRHGVELYHRGAAGKLLFTGGFGNGAAHSESQVGSVFAQSLGVVTTDILIEEISHTTYQNLREAKELMQHNNLRSAIIVSDPLHMNRAMMMAKNLGIEATSSPTPTSRYRSFRAKLGFLRREIYFWHYYVLFKQ